VDGSCSTGIERAKVQLSSTAACVIFDGMLVQLIDWARRAGNLDLALHSKRAAQ
jgi:hypothetical protein